MIFYPLNHRLPRAIADRYRREHIHHLIARARQTGCWIVSSDVVADDATHLGYGCTAIVDPTGTVLARVDELATGVVTGMLPHAQRARG